MLKSVLTAVTVILLFAHSPAAKAQFIKDKRSGCQVVYEKYWEADSITWSGDCKNKLATGQGTLQWYQQKALVATYIGQMAAGLPSGEGKYTIEGLGVMEGNFLKGVLNGQGKIQFADGRKMQGNFLNGEFLNLDALYLPHLRKVKVSLKDTSNIYDYDNKAGELFYYALVPKSDIKAVLVLLPSTSESVENVISSNRQLMQNCFDNNVLSVVLSINQNKALERDNAAMNFLNTSFEEIISKFNAPREKFILCGLSLGGINALRYTEMSRDPRYKTSIKPVAVIGVDPPVDQADLYNNAKEALAFYKANSGLITESIKVALEEDRFLVDHYQKLFGGSPDEVPEKYIEASNFSRTQPDGGNAKYLVDVPVRLYSDPDILWNLKHKHRDYYHMNAANLSAMTNFLMLKGNKRVEFIPAIGKGYRIDGTRHPHSWSIVDPNECIAWILDVAK